MTNIPLEESPITYILPETSQKEGANGLNFLPTYAWR